MGNKLQGVDHYALSNEMFSCRLNASLLETQDSLIS